MEKIKVGIVGHGNLGRGVEMAISHTSDLELSAIFTRRNPESLVPLTKGVPVYSVEDILKFKGSLDVLILCGGSATDLPKQGPEFASWFNTVDSFDTHAKIPEYFDAVNQSAKEGGNVSIISVGWDPGLFSIQRALFGAVLPTGKDYTFWGKGVSQGHSDAIRRIEGVKDAKQYTVPVSAAIEGARSGKNPDLSTREKHKRECFVVAEEGADLLRIEHEIKTMPNYFADYDTTVTFISQEELERDHGGIPHGGFVIRSGKSGFHSETNHVLEFSLKLESNPEFTSSVLVAYARAAVKLSREGVSGAKTVLDIPVSYLSEKDGATLRRELV